MVALMEAGLSDTRGKLQRHGLGIPRVVPG